MSHSKLPVEIGETIAGKYVVERVLGEGGMGVVVAARHLSLDQRVAIKFLLPESRSLPGLESRFANEARAAARLKSEHVARVVDVDALSDGTPFMVMEYLEGRDLAALLLERGKIPVAEACGYILEACEALAEAHAKGIIHRDLKPGNLFVSCGADGIESVKILDFGVSKTQAPGSSFSLTHTSAVLGSPLYMPPEQMTASRDVDARADLWALGIVLYELVTGALPFDGETLPGLVANIIQLKPKSMLERGAAVPPEFEELVLRCLEKDPSQRISSVGELAAGLSVFTGRRTDVALDRISRLEASSRSSPGLRDSVPQPAPTTGTPQLVLMAQSEAPPPLKTVMSDRKRNAPVIRASQTLAGWDAPEESRPRKAIVLGIAGAVAVAVVSIVALTRHGSEPGATTAPPQTSATAAAGPGPAIATPDPETHPAAPPPTFTVDTPPAPPPTTPTRAARGSRPPPSAAGLATPRPQPPAAGTVSGAPPTPPPAPPPPPPPAPPRNSLVMEPK